MEIDESRNPAAKRPQTEATSGATTDLDGPISTVSGSLPMSAQQSIDSLLSIPVALVFRTCSSQEGRPLLTRAEAECFLRISCLAQEIDTLIGSSESMFLQQRHCNQCAQTKLWSSPSNSPQPPFSQGSGSHTTTKPLSPISGPVLPIFNFLEGQPAPTLQDIYHKLSNLSAELYGCSSILRQSAEQNWTMADALDGVRQNGSEEGPSLSDEKRKVAELEEELCQRIERVLDMSLAEGCADEMSASSARLSQSSQDNQYRRKLFPDSEDQDQGEEIEVDSNEDFQGNRRDQPQQPHGTDGNEGVDHQYALDWRPISECCSELFDDVLDLDSSQEEMKKCENGDDANSNVNGTVNRMHLDDSQRGRDENRDGALEDSIGNDYGGKGSVSENGELEADLVESRIEAQSQNETEQEQREQNDGSIAFTEHTNEYHHNHEQTTEIDKESQRSIQQQARTGDSAAPGLDEEVDEFPPTQDSDLQDNHSSGNRVDRLPIPNVAADENEKHPVILPPHITTQPEGSSFPLTAEDGFEEDDDVRSERVMCSQRTSSAAEALTILGSTTSRDISLY